MVICHVTLASISKNFYFSPNSILNFRKVTKIGEKLAEKQKVIGRKQIGGGKHPPPPPVLVGLIVDLGVSLIILW